MKLLALGLVLATASCAVFAGGSSLLGVLHQVKLM